MAEEKRITIRFDEFEWNELKAVVFAENASKDTASLRYLIANARYRTEHEDKMQQEADEGQPGT